MVAAVASPPRASGVQNTLGPPRRRHYLVVTFRVRLPRPHQFRHPLRPRSAGTETRDPRHLHGRYALGPHARPVGISRCAPLTKTVRVLLLIVADDFSSAHGVSPEATEPVENKCPLQGDTCPPQGLTAATPLAPPDFAPYPHESR